MAKVRCRNKSCREYGRKEEMLKVPLGYFCDRDCVIGHASSKEAIEKGRAKLKKIEREGVRKRKKELLNKDRNHLKVTLRQALHKMIRLLDEGKPCICCGSIIDTCHAGHFKSAGAHEEIRFHPRNIHAQRAGCNLYAERSKAAERTMEQGYREGLLRRYGQSFVDWFEVEQPLQKFTCEELIALRKVYSAEATRLEKGLGSSRDWRSLEDLRSLICLQES